MKQRIMSQAHEWVVEHGLDTKDDSLVQSDGRSVPDLVSDDPFSGGDLSEFYVEASEDSENSGGSLGTCPGVIFPDGSSVWWTTEFWSFTDAHGFDASNEWQLTEVTRNSRRR